MHWIDEAEYRAAGEADAQVLLEQSPGHYPEFERFFAERLTEGGGALYFRGESGRVYRLAPTSGDAPGAVTGIELRVRVRGAVDQSGLDADEGIDLDIWPLLEWLIGGVGGEWTVEDLRKAGGLYKVPGAPERS